MTIVPFGGVRADTYKDEPISGFKPQIASANPAAPQTPEILETSEETKPNDGAVITSGDSVTKEGGQ